MLGFFIALTLLGVGIIVMTELHGNHAIGADGSRLQTTMSIAITLATCFSTLLGSMMLYNCKDLLGENYGKAVTGLKILIPVSMIITLFWVRSGLEHSMSTKDVRGKASAEEVAWLDVESRLQKEVDRAKVDGTEVATLRISIDSSREKIASLAKAANDLDNDGLKNDHLIPGLLAEAESRKADLANLESRLVAALQSQAVVAAQVAADLREHQSTRAAVLGGIASAQATQHQFARMATDLASIFPTLPDGWALQLVLIAMAASFMIPQYVGLAGISATLKIQVEDATAAAVEVESTEDQGTITEPENVIQGSFAMDDLSTLPRPALRKLVRACRHTGIIRGVTGKSISHMPVDQLRDLIKEAQWTDKFAQLVRTVA